MHHEQSPLSAAKYRLGPSLQCMQLCHFFLRVRVVPSAVHTLAITFYSTDV
jgi:hypothetical protein